MALVTGSVRLLTLKRRKIRFTGEPSTRSSFDVPYLAEGEESFT